MKGAAFFIMMFVLAVFAGCVSHPEPFTSRSYILSPRQTIQITPLQLSITNKGCGRQWEGDTEKPFCGLEIRHKDSTIHAGQNYKPVYIGTIKIEIDKMNPWGLTEDSIPPGGCRIIVTKLPDNSR
jgi:hypothetical protein